MSARNEYAETREKLHELMVIECRRRRALYRSIRPRGDDGIDKAAQRARLLVDVLQRWGSHPIEFIKDMGWAPDGQDNFGASRIPKGLSPRGMVPIIPFRVQTDLVNRFKGMLDRDGRSALVAVKSRQVAFTTILMWCALWGWLFRDNTQGILGSYGKEYIDSGGKGSRSAVSLFGRLRLFLDAMIECLPHLAFNAHTHGRQRRATSREVGLSDSDDVAFMLTRPDWFVLKNEQGKWVDLFPGAKGNWLKGALPSDEFGRSLTATYAMMDELGQYVAALGTNKDKAAWMASVNNVKCRLGWGTIPEKGGHGTYFYDLVEAVHPDDLGVVDRMKCHWSDVGFYMQGAEWICRHCEGRNPHPVHPGPGPFGEDRECAHCRRTVTVKYPDITSPWFRETCAIMRHDKVAIARELQMDWMAAQGDLLFSTIDAHRLVDRAEEKMSFITFEGMDPGWTAKNTGAWMRVRFDPRTQTPYLVGYWMSINPMPEYWLPLLKRWTPDQTRRMPLVYGRTVHARSSKGQTFGAAFDYPDEFYEMLAYNAKYPPGHLEGDRFGQNNLAGVTYYGVLSDYGVTVSTRKTKDREALVQDGVEWAGRLVVDENIATIRPPRPGSGHFPSAADIFLTAKPVNPGGQSEGKMDVDKMEPPYVHGGVDAWLYLVRGFAGDVHALATPSGDWRVDGHQAARDVDIRSFDW